MQEDAPCLDEQEYYDEHVQCQTSTKRPLPQKRQRVEVRRSKEDNLLDKAFGVLEKANQQNAIREDADDTFGKTVANSLREIENKRAKALAKLKSQDILFNAQTGLYDAPAPPMYQHQGRIQHIF